MDAIIKAIGKTPSLATLPLRVEEGYLPALLTQSGGAMRALGAAMLRRETDRPIFVLCTDETNAGTLAADLEALLGESVVQLTGRDLALRDIEVVSRQEEQRRLRALDALYAGAGVAVCTVSGLLQRTLPPDILENAAFTLRLGEGEGPEALEPRLLACGYRRSDMVEGPGQFSRRGGILDIFSPGAERPVRAEFWDDEIDSMGFFDTDTQRRAENIESFRVLPACESLVDPSCAGSIAKALLSRAARAERREQTELARRLRRDAELISTGAPLPWSDRYLPELYSEYSTALDFIAPDAIVYIDAPNRCAEKAKDISDSLTDDLKILREGAFPVAETGDYLLPWKDACEKIADFAVVMADAFSAGRYPLSPRSVLDTNVRQLPSYGGSAETALADVQRYLENDFRVVVFASDDRRADVLAAMLERNGIPPLRGFPNGALPPEGRATVAVGALSAGLEAPEAHLAVLTDTQIAAGALRSRKRRRAMADREKLGSCADLSVGDLVVHEHHGIGRFAGIFKLPVDGIEKDYIKICYAGSDSLYVPATQLDLVSKYIGGGEDRPVKLSRMGGAEWKKTTSRAKAAAKELAAELTKLYAARARTPGYAFAPDSPWMTEFEEAFGYAETDDQLRCIQEIKDDMEKPVPMDRLLCGDVGYGKTEVALRAAMKCILDGKQCAILVPTTVLARQHYQTAMRRFFGYPVEIALLSRYSTPGQKKDILKKTLAGSVDLLIGTHSLLQKSVVFKDLGLLIVDEEQRFGVSHKEKLKEMSKGVDVLTLSATPIPRTLNMALSGLRSMSTIEEPPRDRQPVQTFVMEQDEKAVCDAIRRELLRGGQVYYLHNRVENIEHVALRLQKQLGGGVSVGVAHGKMDEEQLSRVMDDMVEGKIQVLVCTTIIETGIDIPNVNTLIVEDADKLGLAQLHQLRGRVGRSARRASAYLLYRPEKALTEIAEKRLTAIREFAEFNAGFQIAMRDLEIRGAGNLLGAEQSGHMMDVGYDMYLKLLEEAVLEEKGEKPPVRTECAADLSVTANIPEKYVPSAEQRMDLYRRIALIRTEADADDLTDELIDRFGDPPSAVNALIHVALLRGEAGRAGISDISQKGNMLYFKVENFDMETLSALYAQKEFKNRVKLEAGREPRLGLRLRPGARPIPEARALVEAWNKLQKPAAEPAAEKE